MWAIHNSIKGWTLYGLSQHEVQLIINTMSPNEIKLTQVCKNDGKEWAYVHPDLHPDLFSATGKKNTGFPDIQASTTSTSELDTDFFIIKPKKTFHARLHDRIDIELKVELEGQNKTFESVTVDVSEGGIFFKDPIPDWVSGYFIVRVYSANNTAYQVICSLVEDQKVKQRVQVVSEENDAHFLKYKSWLKSLKNAA